MSYYNRKSVRVVTPPSSGDRAVTVEEMKAYLRIDTTDDDNLIGMFIDAATQAVRNWTWRAILKETLEFTIDRVGGGDDAIVGLGSGVHTISKDYLLSQPNDIDLPFPPVISVSSVKTYNQSNVEATFDAANYLVDGNSGRISLNQGKNWPSGLRDRQGMKITYIAGYEAEDIPAPIKTAITIHTAYMYECRQACELPPSCMALLEPYKLYDMLAFC